jgi:protein-disulfide isomerase-like protein with CxxC motif
VQFFGASTDKEIADARHVADKLKLSYPVLRADDLAKAYGIGGFPTLLVIDPQGRVRGIFTGYSLTLREDIIQCVNDLLREAKGRSRSN